MHIIGLDVVDTVASIDVGGWLVGIPSEISDSLRDTSRSMPPHTAARTRYSAIAVFVEIWTLSKWSFPNAATLLLIIIVN